MASLAGDPVDCPHLAECPGCPLMREPYAGQLAIKRRAVERERDGYHELADVVVEAAVPAEPRVAYRARAKLVVSGPSLGLYAEGSHRVVDIPECRVLAPALLRVARAVRGALPAPFPLRAIDLRATDGGTFVTLVVADGADESAVRSFAGRLLDATTDVVGLSVAHRHEASPTVLGRTPAPLLGASRAERRLLPGGPFHLVAPGAFAQAHEGQERAIVQRILSLVPERCGRAARVLDLFSGAGAGTLALAAAGHDVTSVEAYAPATSLCSAAAASQGLDVRSITADAGAALRRFLGSGERFDAIVVNPPRRGISPDLRADLARLAPELLLYVSCEPRSLARDAADLSRRGLVPERFVPIDMMPQSGDVETLAIFSRAEMPAPRVLLENETFLFVDKPPHEATVDGGASGPSLLARVRRLPGAEEAVPVLPLSATTSGVVAFVRRPELAVRVSERTSARSEYTVLARGITRPKGSVRRPAGDRGGAEARTRYVRREVVGGHSLLAVRTEDERKHQIRRHLANLGHPIVGDTRYGHGPTNQFFTMRHLLDRPFVHRSRLSVMAGGTEVQVESDLPRDLAIVIDELRFLRSVPC